MYNPREDIAAIMAYTERPDADPAKRFALISTMSRYQEQLKHLQQLKEAIDGHGAMMELRDSYGKEVMIENPAIRAYAKASREANATVKTLMTIYRSL